MLESIQARFSLSDETSLDNNCPGKPVFNHGCGACLRPGRAGAQTRRCGQRTAVHRDVANSRFIPIAHVDFLGREFRRGFNCPGAAAGQDLLRRSRCARAGFQCGARTGHLANADLGAFSARRHLCAHGSSAGLHAVSARLKLAGFPHGSGFELQTGKHGIRGREAWCGPCAISITLLRLLLRDGLPAVGPTESKSSILPGSDFNTASKEARLQRANKFLLGATAAALILELVFLFDLVSAGGTNAGATRFLLCVMLVPHGIILMRSWRGPDRLSLGLATGYGLLIAYMGAIFLPNFLIGLAWVASPPNRSS
jgi:hypothetical protein